jgi:lactoylglutathione lyase
MELGAFSLSLAVKDITASQAFYEKLGFEVSGGGDNWKILRNGTTVLGLFQGMFERNALTFNPGWGQDAAQVDPFTDVRRLEELLKERGVAVQVSNTADSESGPAHLMLEDPDGNPILVDQHR